MIEPRRPSLLWNHLGRQLKMWRSYKVTDAHSVKLMKLWLGYEFTDLMDQFGRYTSLHFNEIRRRLGYKHFFQLMEDIRRCRSFFIVGTSEDKVTAIFSPVWHKWDEADGMILQGSCDTENKDNNDDESRISSRICDVSKNIYTKNNTTVSNDDAFSPDGGSEQEVGRDVMARKQVVRDYFKWLDRQPMTEHKALVDNIMLRICKPLDKKGKLLTQYCLTEEQGQEVWDVLVEKVLVPYFRTREEFFKPVYMQHPEKRIWWMTALFKKWGGGFITDATKKWKHNRRSIEAEAANAQIEAQKLYRPHSPHEWEDPNGQRWYITPKGTKQQIPADAPPRPSENANFNYIRGEWLVGSG